MVAGGRRVRAARNRMAAARRPEESDDEEADEEDAAEGEEKADKQVKGTKKLKKLQDKAEKKAQREADMQEREERKKREALQEEERKKEEAREEAQEQARIEEEKRRKEEEERREHEEYLKLKEAFIVEEEGTEGNEDQDAEALLQEFINNIKENKVVILEDLASQFRLKTQECIDRVQSLISEGQLTGVIDDRGKFIYITMEELEAVAKFIRQRGRVSITELAESSNKLIRLNPETVQQKETTVPS